MPANKNKCSGCEHYDGFNGDNVRCEIGNKATIDRGCSSFTPDITANCRECFYNQSGMRISDLECSKHGFLKSQREYCSDYAERWGDTPSESSSNSSDGSWIFWLLVIGGLIWFFSG